MEWGGGESFISTIESRLLHFYCASLREKEGGKKGKKNRRKAIFIKEKERYFVH